MSPIDPLIAPAPVPALQPMPRSNPRTEFLYPADPVSIRPALKLTQGEDPSIEIIEKRKPCSKTYRLGPNTFKVITSPLVVHYDNNGVMEEIDFTIEDINGKKMMTKAPYKIEIFTDRVGYHLQKSDGTDFTIELVRINGSAVDNTPLQSTPNDCQLFWDGLVEDISMKILLMSGKPEIYTQISSPTAPREFTWKVVQNGQFEFKSFGADSNKDSLELLIDRQPIDEKSFYYTETWTGRISRKDKKTRIKRWANDPVYPLVNDSLAPVYPVVIDPSSVTIEITQTKDNVVQATTNAIPIGESHYIFMGYNYSKYYKGGFLFRNSGIPPGATITSAQFKLWVSKLYSNPRLTVWGDKTAPAQAWSASYRPSNITKTTNSTLWTPMTSNKLNNIGVTKQVSSIVGLGGWASDDYIKFAVIPLATGNHAQVYVNAWGNSSAPTLVIVFTTVNPARNGDMNFMGV